MARSTYRVNADMWTVLQDLLVAIPEDFNSDSASLRGRTMNVGLRSKLGRLPDEYRAQWHNANVEYAIWSYDTPIAWREYTISPNAVKGSSGKRVGYSHYRWVMPNEKYSVTTSKHQGKVATALSQISGGI